MFKGIEKRFLFSSDFIASSVLAIDYKYLKSIGIEAVAFDVDGTLTKRGAEVINDGLALKLNHLLDEAAITNRILATNSNRNMSAVLSKLSGFRHVNSKGGMPKPFKSYYGNLIYTLNLPADKIVMIGDRWLQDTWGAKNSGIKTVYVSLDPELVTFKDRLILRHKWQPRLVKQ